MSESKHLIQRTKHAEEENKVKKVLNAENREKPKPKPNNTEQKYKKRSRDTRKPSISRPSQLLRENLFKWHFWGMILFSSKDVQNHDNHAKIFLKKFFQPNEAKGRIMLISQESNCDCYFIQQKDWITEYEGNAERILCPRKTCAVKLGGYSWSGLKWNWGIFKSPAFQISKKAVVEVSQFL